MNTVKIRSNPYKKEVSFFSLNENNEWYDIKDDNRDGKLREMSSDKMFLPFRIKEIIDIISNEQYVPGGDKVKVIFEGTEDEYEEVLAVCSDEDIADKVILERSAELLDDARDILKNIKEIFFNVNPILAGIIGEGIWKNRRIVPVITMFFSSIIKLITVFIIIYIIGIKATLFKNMYVAFYNSILMALAGKKKGLTEISNIMNEEVTKVNKYIKTLTEAEIIIKRETYNSKRQTNYYILDPVLRFYYKFLLNNIEKIEAGYGQMLYERLKADIDKFISYSFEDVAISYIEFLGKNGKLGGIYYPIQNLTIEKSELGRSIEIDGIARDGDSLLVIECKFTNEKRSIRDYEKMVENTSIKMFEGIKKYNYYIVSKTGFDKTLTDLKKDNLHLISIDEMMSTK